MFKLATKLDLEIYNINVNTTFLNGFINEEIYMDQPKGYIHLGKLKKNCKFLKSFYGFKQSLKTWFEKINSHLINIGFENPNAN